MQILKEDYYIPINSPFLIQLILQSEIQFSRLFKFISPLSETDEIVHNK